MRGTYTQRQTDNERDLVCCMLKGDDGEITWICPACKQPDDGSPMIGCDLCDDWYHWLVDQPITRIRITHSLSLCLA